MKNLKFFKDFVSFKILLFTVCLTLLNSLIELGFVYLIVQTITSDTLNLIFTKVNVSTTGSKIQIIVALVSIKFAIGLLTTFHTNILVASVWHRFVVTLFKTIITSPYHEFYSTPTGVYTRKLIVDAQRVCYELLLPGILIVSEILVTILLITYAINLVDPYLAKQLFYILLSSSLLVAIVIIYIRRLGVERTVAEGELSDVLDSAFKGYIFARVNNYQSEIIRLVAELSSKSIKAIRNHSIISQTPRYLFEIVMIFLLLLMLQDFHSETKITTNSNFAEIVAIFLIFIRITPSLNRILTYTGQIMFNFHLSNQEFSSNLDTSEKSENRLRRGNQTLLTDLEEGLILVKNTSLKLGPKQVFYNKSFQFDRGKIYALKGQNGSGKSSFLKMLAGLIEPTTGSISIRKNDESEILNIYYLDQNSFMFRGTVESNIFLDSDATIATRDRVKNLVEYFFPGLDANEYLGRNVTHTGANFSGGEKQKISLIRAIIQEPEVILLDEPFSAVDVQMRSKIYLDLKDLFSSALTIIIVTHNDEEFRYMDEVLDF